MLMLDSFVLHLFVLVFFLFNKLMSTLQAHDAEEGLRRDRLELGGHRRVHRGPVQLQELPVLQGSFATKGCQSQVGTK